MAVVQCSDVKATVILFTKLPLIVTNFDTGCLPITLLTCNQRWAAIWENVYYLYSSTPPYLIKSWTSISYHSPKNQLHCQFSLQHILNLILLTDCYHNVTHARSMMLSS